MTSAWFFHYMLVFSLPFHVGSVRVGRDLHRQGNKPGPSACQVSTLPLNHRCSLIFYIVCLDPSTSLSLSLLPSLPFSLFLSFCGTWGFKLQETKSVKPIYMSTICLLTPNVGLHGNVHVMFKPRHTSLTSFLNRTVTCAETLTLPF